MKILIENKTPQFQSTKIPNSLPTEKEFKKIDTTNAESAAQEKTNHILQVKLRAEPRYSP